MANITILEDYLPLSRLMADFLRSRGHRVNTATNAFDGLARIKEGAPDIVLVDLALGQDDGLGVIKKAKASGVKSKFMVVTGSTEVRQVVEAMKCGAEDYCTKPFKLDSLHQAIEDCLAGATDGAITPLVDPSNVSQPAATLAAQLKPILQELPPSLPLSAASSPQLASPAAERRWWHTLKDTAMASSISFAGGDDPRPASTRLLVLRGGAAT
jgi:two-component system, response regulator RegA